MYRLLIGFLCVTLAGGALAQMSKGGVPVYCGSFTCFSLRAPVLGKDPESRAVAAMDVINKYLGGKVGKVTVQENGKYVRILLNNELVVSVSAEDAANEKAKTPKVLAERWAKKLSVAFDASKAQPG